jgi:micrococcal nuclease
MADAGRFAYTGKVTRVVDGDTIDVRLTSGKRERVRLIGIDTPELRPAECYATEAKSRATALALGKTVRLRGDPTQDTRDRYRRLLAYVSLANGTDVGRTLLAGGFAKVYVFERNFVRLSTYRTAETAAKSAQRGMWVACAQPEAEPEPVAEPACSDGADNDGDGRADYPLDPGCSSSTDTDERGASYQCDDGADNDADGVADYPGDSDCSSAYDSTESTPPGASCHPNYSPCLPIVSDLDCADVRAMGKAPVQVTGSDPYRLDGDGDGVGCE